MQDIVVIGNIFRAESASRLWRLERIDRKSINGLKELQLRSVTFGQGIKLSQALRVKERLVSAGILSRERIRIPQYLYHKIQPQLVHKRCDRNVIISEVSKNSKNKYCCWLYVDQSPDMLRDHLTGIHLPAMFLQEAVRQLITAVLNVHARPWQDQVAFQNAQVGWVCRFFQYVFPLAVSFELEIADSREIGKSVQRIFDVDCMQGGHLVAKFQSIVKSALRPQVQAIESGLLECRLHDMSLESNREGLACLQ